MRFDITSLLAIVTVAAVYMMVIRTQPVLALAFVSTYFAVGALVKAVPDTRAKLMTKGAIAAVCGMQAFMFATLAFWVAYSFFVSQESQEYVLDHFGWYIKYVTSVVLFYGALAALWGGLLGFGCDCLLRLLPRRK